MGYGILNADEVKEYIEAKLKSGWCIIQGNINAICEIEKKAYTPGTEHNGDFESFMMTGVGPTIFIGKKNKKLCEILNNPADIDNVYVITIIRIDEKRIGIDVLCGKDETSISEIGDNIKKLIDE